MLVLFTDFISGEHSDNDASEDNDDNEDNDLDRITVLWPAAHQSGTGQGCPPARGHRFQWFLN